MSLEKNSLRVDEYNKILKKFDQDIIEPCKKSNQIIDISELGSHEFAPLIVISEFALNKLKIFCTIANKSTGSSHPSD